VVVALIGNPRAGSRTASIAAAVATSAAGSLGERLGPVEVAVHDLAELTARIGAPLGAGAGDRYEPVLAAVRRAAVLIVATPVYKASYTGLLKSFLDLLPSQGLAGVVAVPVVTLGAPDHRLAADVHLRPLLLELGASTPTPALVVGGQALDDAGPVITGWWEAAAPALVAAVSGAPGPSRPRQPAQVPA
jgi:FMN reductase